MEIHYTLCPKYNIKVLVGSVSKYKKGIITLIMYLYIPELKEFYGLPSARQRTAAFLKERYGSSLHDVSQKMDCQQKFNSLDT
jgi:hypothetical protein